MTKTSNYLSLRSYYLTTCALSLCKIPSWVTSSVFSNANVYFTLFLKWDNYTFNITQYQLTSFRLSFSQARLNYSLMFQFCATLSNIWNGKISMFVLCTFLIRRFGSLIVFSFVTWIEILLAMKILNQNPSLTLIVFLGLVCQWCNQIHQWLHGFSFCYDSAWTSSCQHPFKDGSGLQQKRYWRVCSISFLVYIVANIFNCLFWISILIFLGI